MILNIFKRHGIVLSDGGNVALTAESDLYTDTSLESLGIDSRVFDLTPGAADVAVDDFEVVDTGSRIAETWECERTSVGPGGWIFGDGFESGALGAWSAVVP